MIRLHEHSRPRAGFSTLEMLVAVLVLSLLAGSLSLSMERMRDMASSSNVEAQLQDSAERAMRRIRADLSRSGVVLGYPTFFVNGAGPGPHAHAPATQSAAPGDPDFGDSREIVFLLPQESDPPGTFGHDVPDIDANANLIWDPTETSFVLVTGVDGVNYLQRRVAGGSPVTIASNVERVVFDDSASSGGALLPNCVRVRIFFRKRDGAGGLHRYAAEQVIQLRNDP